MTWVTVVNSTQAAVRAVWLLSCHPLLQRGVDQLEPASVASVPSAEPRLPVMRSHSLGSSHGPARRSSSATSAASADLLRIAASPAPQFVSSIVVLSSPAVEVFKCRDFLRLPFLQVSACRLVVRLLRQISGFLPSCCGAASSDSHLNHGESGGLDRVGRSGHRDSADHEQIRIDRVSDADTIPRFRIRCSVVPKPI